MKNLRILALMAITIMSTTLVAVNLENYMTGKGTEGNTLAHIFIENCDNENFTLELHPFKMIENNIPDEQALLFECFEKINTVPQEMQDIMLMACLAEIGMKLNEKQDLLHSLLQAIAVDDIFTAKNNKDETIFDIAKRKSVQNPESKRCRFCDNVLEFVKALELESDNTE